MEDTLNYKTKEILGKLEGYLKFKHLSKQDLAEKWKKTDIYVYRRFSGKVEFSLTDILELCEIIGLTKQEAADIFF